MAPIILEKNDRCQFSPKPPRTRKGLHIRCDHVMAVRFHVASNLHHDNLKVACEYASRPNKAAPLFGQRLHPVTRYQYLVLFNHNQSSQSHPNNNTFTTSFPKPQASLARSVEGFTINFEADHHASYEITFYMERQWPFILNVEISVPLFRIRKVIMAPRLSSSPLFQSILAPQLF